MFYTFQTLKDEFGTDYTVRFGRPTASFDAAKRQLNRLQQGEIRDEFNRLLGLKFNSETRFVK